MEGRGGGRGTGLLVPSIMKEAGRGMRQGGRRGRRIPETLGCGVSKTERGLAMREEREMALNDVVSASSLVFLVLQDNEHHSYKTGTFYLCIYGRKLQTRLGWCCHINYKSFKGKKFQRE